MKRIVYIGLFITGLVFTSCQKQDFTPNADRSTDVPAWECDNHRSGEDDGIGKPTFDPGGDGIVDPNGEEEENDNK